MPSSHLTIWFAVSVMQNVWVGVKDRSNSVTTKVSDGRKASFHNNVFNDTTDILVVVARFAKLHGRYPAIICCLQQFLGSLIRFASNKHFRAVTVVAIQVARNVEIDQVAFIELAIIWNAMADYLIDRGTARFGKSVVVERGWVSTSLNQDRIVKLQGESTSFQTPTIIHSRQIV